MDNWIRMNYQPCLPVGEDGTIITSCEKHIELSRYAATEGMVLLKNDGTLPLKKGTRIALFGKAQYDYVKGGGGSGNVFCKYIRNIYEGFKIKESEGKLEVYDGLYEYYKNELDKQYSNGVKVGLTIEPVLSEEQIKKAREYTDTAIITICRFSGEGWDRSSDKGDFYLSDEEQLMVDSVCKAFTKVLVILNVGGMVDSEWFHSNETIKASLLAWNAGMEGGLAIADIFCGDVTPSGKLVDTFAKSFDDYPSSANYNESDDYVKYYDDIYVGYRYFETIPGAAEKVNYCFGFGLSYTKFELSDIKVEASGEIINATIKVTNTGDFKGREVVQLYSSAPQGRLGRPSRELKAFKKTSLLSPGESEIIKLEFSVKDMAAFDDYGKCEKSAYVLEKGSYEFYIGTSVRDTVRADFVYEVKEDFIVVEKLTSLVAPSKLEKRLSADGSFENLPLNQPKPFEYKKLSKNESNPPEKETTLAHVALGDITINEFLAQLTTDELIELLGGHPNKGLANTCGMGADRDSSLFSKYRVPCAMTADGPAGLRLKSECEIPTTAWPCATLLACTWDCDILEKVGIAGASEVLENNLSIWLTPALNIHRSPLCGRNFEYFSEDPLVSGKMAAAKVRGIQSKKIAASVKHFACNNKEVNRYESDSIVSERALREIYLKGFEICVKEADPWTIMTSYNKVNGHQSSEHYELLTGILRGEWGYKGMITTDWWCHGIHYLEIKAGNDIKMANGFPESIKEAVISKVSREELEACARRVLELLIKLR